MKNKIFYVLVLAFLVFISFYYGGLIKQNVLRVNDFVIGNFYNIKDYLENLAKEKTIIYMNNMKQLGYSVKEVIDMIERNE